jgi:hypothetical protein
MAYNDDEARDQKGRWTRSGDSGELPRGVIDPRATDVAGDKWNSSTAKRLEAEYAAVRPDLDAIVTKGIEEGADVETGGGGASWDSLSGDAQEKAQDAFNEQNHDSYYDSEVQNWADNGEALNEAKHNVADDNDFKEEFLAGFIEDRGDDEEPLPYTAQQLSDAMEITANDDGGDPEVTFNRDKLGEPNNLNPNESPDQLALPGVDIKPIKGPDKFTPELEDALRDAYIEAFNEEAEKKAGDIEPPDYLNESAHEGTQSAWDNMDDEAKYEWTKNNTEVISDADEGDGGGSTTLELPEKFDPMNETSGEDYRRTQAIAKYLSDHRAAQLITERANAGIIGPKWAITRPENNSRGDWIVHSKTDLKGTHYATEAEANAALASKLKEGSAPKDAAWTERMLGEVQSVDNRLWSGWKSSSTGEEGRILQVAAADELGGRLREQKTVDKPQDHPENDPPEVVAAKATVGDSQASPYKTQMSKSLIAAYNAGAPPDVIKAFHKLVYPGLTTTGPLKENDLDPAAKKTVQDWEKSQKYNVADIPNTPVMKSEAVDGFIRLPEVSIARNGAASTTISRDVANGWSGTTNYAPSGINKQAVIASANEQFKNIGGYEGVKAAIRAKWEATQYLLDRADMPVVQAYRGITMPHKLEGAATKNEFNTPISGVVKAYHNGKDADEFVDYNLADAKVGDSVTIKSGKTITKESMDGGGYSAIDNKIQFGKWTYEQPQETQSRIVMRAEVPRTAVVSVPAYGVNVHSEQEVVVVGTAWRNWDAWSGRAPSFEQVPMGAKESGDKEAALGALKTANTDAANKEMADLEEFVGGLKTAKKAA